MPHSEEQLIDAARAGDTKALEALLALYAPSVLRFGLKMCRDSEDAKDVLQEVLLAAARSIHDFRGDASFATWLFTVARSFCIKKHRVSKFAPKETISLDQEGAATQVAGTDLAPDELAADRELGAALNRAIDELEPQSREVLLLRDVEGLTAPEVATVLSISVDAVKSRLHRARAQVRARMEPVLPETHRVAPPSADCPEIVTIFSRYLEGEIGQAECASMERHVASCDRCRAACDSLKHTLALCRATPKGGDVPEDVQALVRSALRQLSVPR